MRVLAFNYEFPPVGGGGGRALEFLCRHLPEFGVKIDAVVSRGLESAPFNIGPSRIFSVPTHRRSLHETGPSAMVEYLVKASLLGRKLLAEGIYDILHYFFSVPTGLLNFSLGGRRPYVVSLRGGDVPGFNPGEFLLAHEILRPANASVLKRASAVVAISEALRRHASSSLADVPIEVIRNGVDTERFIPSLDEPNPVDSCRLIYAGRMVEWKGLRYLIEAMRLLPANVRLDLVGTGAEMPALRHLSVSLGLEGRVEFLGARKHEELVEFYRASDIFVIPSYGESFSQVTAEAMASGLPIIAARAGALPELVGHDVNGILVEPKSADAIAGAVLRLFRDRDLRRRMATANRTKAVTELSWRRNAERYAALYRACLSDTAQSTNATSSGGTASTT